MSVQIIADLHLEAPKAYDLFDITPKAPYLALLGDIGNVVPHKDDFLGFLLRQLGQFKIVFFVPGNHEPYHSSWPQSLQILHEFEEEVAKNASIGDFILLDRRSFQLPGTNLVILGCSFFSSIPANRETEVSFGLNDFFQIDNWDIKSHNEAHHRDLAWLNEEVVKLEEKPNVTVFIFTHWSPSADSRAADPRHMNSPISSAFSTDTSDEPCFKSNKVKLWAFGHTHYNCDFEVERGEGASPLRLLANQRGYYFAQAQGFDVEKTVDILT